MADNMADNMAVRRYRQIIYGEFGENFFYCSALEMEIAEISLSF